MEMKKERKFPTNTPDLRPFSTELKSGRISTGVKRGKFSTEQKSGWSVFN